MKKITEAIVFPEKKKIDIRKVTIPDLKPRDVLIKIEYSGISGGTERRCYTGMLNLPGKPPLAFPHVPGYQAAGTVVEMGKNVKGLKPGDRVFTRNCRSPENWQGSWWGGHVGYHTADAEGDVIKLDQGISALEASYLLLAQVGFNGASKPRVENGMTALIIGDGLVGQFASQVLRSRGVHTILSGLCPERLALAEKYSADEIHDNRNFDIVDAIKQRYSSGIDIVLETASSQKTVLEGIAMLKKEGQLILNGFYPYPYDSRLDWHWIRRKELTLYFPDSRNRIRLYSTLKLLSSGEIIIAPLVTCTFPWERAQEAYSMLLDSPEKYLGLVLDWTDFS